MAGVLTTTAAPVVMVFVIIKGFKVFPKTPIGRMMILGKPQEQSSARAGTDAALPAGEPNGELVGAEGTTRTELRPSGSAEIGDRRYQVVSCGDYIGEGTAVRVVEVRGNRIVVEALSRDR